MHMVRADRDRTDGPAPMFRHFLDCAIYRRTHRGIQDRRRVLEPRSIVVLNDRVGRLFARAASKFGVPAALIATEPGAVGCPSEKVDHGVPSVPDRRRERKAQPISLTLDQAARPRRSRSGLAKGVSSRPSTSPERKRWGFPAQSVSAGPPFTSTQFIPMPNHPHPPSC